MNDKVSTVSIIGLGKLGSPIASAYASQGMQVIGVDVNEAYVTAINKGRAPIFEPKLQELLTQNKERLSATESIADAVHRSDMTIIVVGTPSTSDGDFSLKYALPAAKEIGAALRNKDAYHLVVVTSTVMPGATDNEIIPVIEQASGKKVGSDFGVCYSPEFIALGSVIDDFLNPDFVLIGESDKVAGDIMESVYTKVCTNNPSASRMNITNAEITKISLNTYCTTKISFANTLARMCEKIPGANVDTVTDALGMDTRIGGKYLKGAIGYGGPCFPRDTVAFTVAASQVGVPTPLIDGTAETNELQVDHLVHLVEQHSSTKEISLLGLAYKPDTDVTEESQSVLLAKKLLAKGYTIHAFDPAAMENAAKVFGGDIKLLSTAEKCVAASDLTLLMTPWSVFKDIPPKTFKDKSIIDCWRYLTTEQTKDTTSTLSLGIFNGEETKVNAKPIQA